MQNRDGDLSEFFAHEMQTFRSLLPYQIWASFICQNTKSDMLKCIEDFDEPEPPSIYDCKVLDDAVIVHCLPAANVSIFLEYAKRIFIPYLEKQLGLPQNWMLYEIHTHRTV